MNIKKIKSIRRAANIGFYGSLFFAALTIAEHFFAEYVWVKTIVASEYTHKLFLSVGLIFAVADIAAILFMLRNQLPKLRQLDSLEEKLLRYTSIVRTIYFMTLFVVILVSAVIIVLNENTLIMLLLLMVVMLMLAYPNMYKIKADLGLLDEEMTELFGDKYIK